MKQVRWDGGMDWGWQRDGHKRERVRSTRSVVQCAVWALGREKGSSVPGSGTGVTVCGCGCGILGSNCNCSRIGRTWGAGPKTEPFFTVLQSWSPWLHSCAAEQTYSTLSMHFFAHRSKNVFALYHLHKHTADNISRNAVPDHRRRSSEWLGDNGRVLAPIDLGIPNAI